MDELKTIEGEFTMDAPAKNDTPKEFNELKLVKRQEPEVKVRAEAVAAPMPLFSESEMEEFRSQWTRIQTCFVDEPRGTVKDADKLVAALMQRLAEGFANERSGLEKQWDRGDNVSTEDLRIALQRYRSFFDRLLKL